VVLVRLWSSGFENNESGAIAKYFIPAQLLGTLTLKLQIDFSK
jgi:hypothetical protein